MFRAARVFRVLRVSGFRSFAQGLVSGRTHLQPVVCGATHTHILQGLGSRLEFFFTLNTEPQAALNPALRLWGLGTRRALGYQVEKELPVVHDMPINL